MKPAFDLILLTAILVISVLLITFNSSMYSKSAAENKTSSSSSSSPSIKQVQGTLIVTNKVIGGNKKQSDFTINIHTNDPVPSSFLGNSFGTPVQLHMGMYSVTQTGPPGYNLNLSGDCSGG